MINKDKFQNHVLHFLATKRVAAIAKKHKKSEVYQKLKAVRLDSARQDLLDLPDLLDLLDLLDLQDLRDWRDLRDLRDWRDWLDLQDSQDLRDWRDWREIRVKELVAAYVYAGGKKSNLIDRQLNTKLLSDIESKKWIFDQSTWHGEKSCGTTHCTAGGTIVILGNPASELESITGTPTAAAMISYINTGSIPNYYELDDEKALADIRERATKES